MEAYYEFGIFMDSNILYMIIIIAREQIGMILKVMAINTEQKDI